ncbi:MAG: ribose ABC transporter permease [Candidatus Altiarchaeales archaeon WOR_SM1_79]|nr:MAG: ribose ABC transporter permease [Candidatus Altiarchaeales archaeon WOR_SM1_79]
MEQKSEVAAKIIRNRPERLLHIASGLIRRSQAITLLLILIALGAFLSIHTRTFLTPTNIFNILRAFSWIAISAFGQSMVIIGGGIDLSCGSIMAFSGIITAMFLAHELGVIISVVAGLGLGVFLGYVNGMLISKAKLPPFIATLGMMSIARGFSYGLTGGWPIRSLPKDFLFLGQKDVPILLWKIPLPVILMVALAIISFIFLNNTRYGYHIYAVGGNEFSASLAGINIHRIKVMMYILSGFLTAIGGILMTSRLGVAAPTAALGYELDIIAAAVIGGISLRGGEGNLWGALIGAAIMQVLRNGLVLTGFPAYWQPSAIGVVIIVAVMLDQLKKR